MALRTLTGYLKSALRRQKLIRQGRGREIAAVKRTGLIFVHVPKCGGKTVIQDIYGLEEHDWFGHATFAFYERLFGPDISARYRTFSFVRDPVSRVVSAYRFDQKGGFGKQPRPFYGDLSLKAFVHERLAEAAETDILFRPQHLYLFKGDDCMVHDLFAFEDFSNQLAMLKTSIGLSGEVRHANRSSTQVPPDVDDGMRAQIRRVYAEDYRRFATLGARAPAWARS